MEKLNEIKKEISKLELGGKSVKYVLENYGYLYYRIYNYSKKENIWLPKLFFELGLVNGHVDGLDSVEKLDVFMEIFSYKNKDWSLVKSSHKILIKKVLTNFSIRLDVFLIRCNMTNIDRIVYRSIEEIRKDLTSKGLINSSVSQIRNFDQGRTIGNIDSFADKKGLKIKDVWFALNISYDKSLVVCSTGVKKDFVYHDDREMIEDLKSKNLLGKTKRDVWLYDNGKTVSRIQRYSSRCGIDVQSNWDKLGIKNSPKRRIKFSFSNLNELKNVVKERGLAGKTIKEVNALDPDLCFEVKKWARNGTSMKSIWKYVGVLRGQGFSDSVDEIVSEIKKAGYKTIKDIRADWNFYKRIAGFVQRNNITSNQIWEKAGIPFSGEGRPSKVKG